MPPTALARQHNDPSFPSVWEELRWRGLVQVSTDEEALAAALAGGPITAYCGFDPTAPSLHLGHLTQLLVLRRLQLAGHRPLGLVGGSTGLIGDPRPSSERVLHTKELVADWVAAVRTQVERFLDFEGPAAAEMVDNLDWTAPLSAIDFLRDIGKHYRIGTMLKKDAVAARLNSEAGISYTEFSYQILQGYDFLELYRSRGCVLQTGGSDQWGNLTSGIDLIRRAEGAAVHAIGTPLITDSEGRKFSKSEGTAVWLDPAQTSPYAFFQFWLNTSDADVVSRLKVFTFLTREEIEDLERTSTERPGAREAQRRLAWEVTALVHGDAAADAARDASAALFGTGDLASIDEGTLEAALAELPRAAGAVGDRLDVLLVASGLAKSNSDARRAAAQGGVSVNNRRVDDEDAVLTEADLLHGRFAVLRRGKRNLAAVVPG
ncbi:tyrosine--tRNA ligase [Amnibacterium setariae]|uniref:Tyrosine--tRNA ligase n=1 Tax=Amnibacterium setariae TaxID=2306585 RepID=A0A3A1U878_9MICO|nr:tyrosine--tRNA ligase [Amnibacterium setariae]RIX31268.1 tyrosine--tRNA ligase [Amnibacterium setariae]